jgi:PAS domain S-box-containing protein
VNSQPPLNPERKTALKEIIKELHSGTPLKVVKAKADELLRSCSPLEIAQIEEELIREGMPVEQVREFCDIHLEVFKEGLDAHKLAVNESHPLWILREEHKRLLAFTQDLRSLAKTLQTLKDFNAAKPHWDQLLKIVDHFKGAKNHYLREENVLFPYLEKHGITQPPAIMWAEHDEIRALEKRLFTLVDTHAKRKYKEFTSELSELALMLAEMLAGHFHKENNILFPSGLKLITPDEWSQIRHDFDEIGYCCFTPQLQPLKQPIASPTTGVAHEKLIIQMETGALSFEIIEALFNTLPVDITFVDTEDRVQFYSESGGRIFTRTKAVIGRTVQACHPQKSLHKVQQILDDFRAGKRNTAEFWINLKGRTIYIRYFAVHDSNGKYLGCLEITQDVTEIKALEGEKRLLD